MLTEEIYNTEVKETRLNIFELISDELMAHDRDVSTLALVEVLAATCADLPKEDHEKIRCVMNIMFDSYQERAKELLVPSSETVN